MHNIRVDNDLIILLIFDYTLYHSQSCPDQLYKPFKNALLIDLKTENAKKV